MPKATDPRPLKPILNKLRGDYRIGKDLRKKTKLYPNVLCGITSGWNRIQDVVDDYLERSELWESQPIQFVLLLQESLKKMNTILSNQPAHKTTAIELLLIQYTSSLHTFYQHPKFANDLQTYYRKQELKKRTKYNFELLEIQSNSTVLVMALEKSRLIEEKLRKRTFDDVSNEDGDDRCMVSKSSQFHPGCLFNLWLPLLGKKNCAW
ncbi:hypothetical protein INT45_009187 [Circinella minor]|uniref:Uncharacterized protein n=1 Tax=Circinella minor TaxID=1195481 RepID=A0A8H7VMH9_9FUNG|nr:hypothetical protein INT45_009187 [Circinella minor]